MNGAANVGLKYDDSAVDNKITGYREIDVNVLASVETDAGLTFGMSFDLDPNPAQVTDAEVSVSGAFGTVTIGAVDPANDQFFGAQEVGFDGIGVDDAAEGAYYGVSSADLLYSYSVGALSVAASINTASAADEYAIGVQYKGPVTVNFGYADNGTDNTVTTAGLKGSAGAVSYNVSVADYDLTGTGYGVGGSYKVNDALALQVAYASNDWDVDASYGVGFTYDLGGATLGGAAGSINGVTKADLGVNFSF